MTFSDESPVSDGQKNHLTIKLTTAAVFLECITFGCAFNIFSPVLVELKIKYETDIDSMSKIFIILTLSYLIGAMAGGILYGRLMKRQHGVLIAFAGISLSLFATPYCPTITHLFIAVAFLGFNCGAYDTAQTVWIMEMWKEKSGPFLQTQHFCFALGSNLPPLLTAPFLSERQINFENDLDDEEFSCKIPFLIVGGLAGMNVLYEVFLITFFPYNAPETKTEAETKSAVAVINGDKDNNFNSGNKEIITHSSQPPLKPSQPDLKTMHYCHKIQLVTICGLFLGFYQGMEMCSFQFLATFAQVGNSKLSSSEGARILSGLVGSFAFGRLVGILITLKMSAQLILTINVLLVIAGNVILLLWAYLGLSTPFLWGACIILGFGFSTMYASFCAYMERYLVFTDFVGCIMLVSGSIVGIVWVFFVGKFVEHHPEVLTFTNFISVVCCSVAFLTVYFITRKSKINTNSM